MFIHHFLRLLPDVFLALAVQDMMPQDSFSKKDFGVTQSLHGNVYKVVNYERQVTDVCHVLQVELA